MINLDNAQRIIDDYMPLILATIRRFPAFERGETIDEARMVVIEAILDYDVEKGSFGNFLKHKLNYHFWDKYRNPVEISLETPTEGGVIGDLIESDIDIASDLEEVERYQILKNSLARLNKKEREIIRLRFYENMDYDQIGQTLGLSPKTVRNRNSLIIKKLRKMCDFHDLIDLNDR